MDRTAPEGGYNFANKVKYRFRIWEIFRACHGHERYTSNVMFMPSAEGVEIETARKAGYRYERMHVVDRNPAIAAHMKRRWRSVTTYGVEVERAVQRALKKGIKLDAIHLDFCGNIGVSTLAPLIEISANLPSNTCPLIAVNVMRGREIRPVTNWMSSILKSERNDYADTFNYFARDLPETDRSRLGAIASALVGRRSNPDAEARFIPLPLAYGTYKSISGPITMLWSVFLLGGKDTNAHTYGFVDRLKSIRRITGEHIIES